ncbi:MAG: hypothetical protein SPI36_03385, partial [Candidatus Onthovivens sp.]|nr:hypothetical protein [Candidatus Onthovivens sp.]
MNSKEALENIRDYHNETVYDIDNIYTENMFEKELDIIEKDLELLEILKKHYNVNSLTISLDSFISISIYKTDKDFEKI